MSNGRVKKVSIATAIMSIVFTTSVIVYAELPLDINTERQDQGGELPSTETIDEQEATNENPITDEPLNEAPAETPTETSKDYQYVYDENNRLTQVLKNGTVLRTLTYDANGNLVSVTSNQQ
ncbi:RHS repeat domain-containing protein [Tumebacillus lipolyticus]|uniref:RHS repeat domain-containing protein n=1 Tax=Tumebacillus lipolyticus TaxID=1280370 RepID=A0ABW5A2Y6_9BACL